jgi:hypothetical protein
VSRATMRATRIVAGSKPCILCIVRIGKNGSFRRQKRRALQAVLASLNKKAGVPTGAWFRDYFFFSLSQP